MLIIYLRICRTLNPTSRDMRRNRHIKVKITHNNAWCFNARKRYCKPLLISTTLFRDLPNIIWFAATYFRDLQLVQATVITINYLECFKPETFKDLCAARNIRDNEALANKSCLPVSCRTVSLREVRVDGP